MEYDIERHVKKFGPITEDTVMRMIFFLHVFTIGKNDSTIKEYLKRLKDNRKYLEATQSWNEMTEVVEEFILRIIRNDETQDKEKMKKRAVSLVEAQPPRPQIRNIDGAGRGVGRGRGLWCGLWRKPWQSRPLQSRDVRREAEAIERWKV
jgi:hypothetical protein